MPLSGSSETMIDDRGSTDSTPDGSYRTRNELSERLRMQLMAAKS